MDDGLSITWPILSLNAVNLRSEINYRSICDKRISKNANQTKQKKVSFNIFSPFFEKCLCVSRCWKTHLWFTVCFPFLLEFKFFPPSIDIFLAWLITSLEEKFSTFSHLRKIKTQFKQLSTCSSIWNFPNV